MEARKAAGGGASRKAVLRTKGIFVPTVIVVVGSEAVAKEVSLEAGS